MTIAICTPTGNIGRHVVRELLEAGESIRLIARNPDKLDVETRQRTEVVQGSIEDTSLLTRAFEDVDAVFWCVPQSNTQDDVLDYYLHFANAAAIALRQTATPRVVAVSSGGKGLAKKAGMISALHAMEDILDETGVATCHLRCGNFMENFLWQMEVIAHRGVFLYPFPGDFAIPMVATCDVGITAANWLKRRDWSGQGGIAVQGAEDLSLNQVAEIFSDVLGKPVRFQPISPETCRNFLLQRGSSPAYAQAFLDMCAEATDGIYRAEVRTPETTTLTTLRQWTETVMCPAFNQFAQLSVQEA